jgi:signal transduction histidine kinase/DNA-binding response OmpR family regulator
MRAKQIFYLTFACLSLFVARVTGAWGDQTAGAPWVEHQSARNLGTEALHLFVTEDKLGRLFVGSHGLLVHDGMAWRTYTAGKAGGIRAVQYGPDGRLWIAALNEIGYFTEPSTGNFQYHSLLEHLPQNEREVAHIWGVSVVDSQVYFLGREKLYRWDGSVFQTWSFPGSSRLFPLKLDEESWFQHWESGLYRLTASGPKLEIDRSRLPDTGILALRRDADGVMIASSRGFFRPGTPPKKIFTDEVNRFIIENRLTAHSMLPDGNQIVGTINGGMMIISAEGQLLRIIDSRDHPAIGAVQSLWVRRDGQVWCASQDGIIRFDPTGKITAFQPRNGLEGGASDIEAGGPLFYLCNPSGTYRLMPGAKGRSAFFQREDALKEVYTTLSEHAGGLLLGRHAGLDFFDGATVEPVYGLYGKGVYTIIPTRFPSGNFALSEGDAVVLLRPQPDGSFQRSALAQFPDFVDSLAEDTSGRIWAGALSLGAVVADPATLTGSPVVDPETGDPLRGHVRFEQNDTDLLLFTEDRVLRAEPDGTKLQPLLPLPGVKPGIARSVPGTRSTVLAFKRAGASSASSWGQGLGLLSIGENGSADWYEFDVPSLESVGVVKSMSFTRENGRPILWLGGTEGMLRMDFPAMTRMQAPPSPFIRLDTGASSEAINPGSLEFPFRDHHLSFRVFIGDTTRSKDWLIQARLSQNGATWSAPASRRLYEYSNLSEGIYRFEVRTINGAGQSSEPVSYSFRILPPWYRSATAYAGYACALLLGVWGTIRIRERRILAQQAKLETQVQERTAELVKANAAKDEFLAGVSHEIRNPMNGVIGISESLRTTGLDPESRRKFGLLRQCASHLSSLLEDILDISKMQAGVTELETKAFDLHELVETVSAMAAADSEKYHIPVETAISPGVPRYLIGDPRRIRQILLNFVSNALKFSGRGEVDVTVWCRPAEQPDRTEVIFAISDDGPGISAEEQSRLFKRFERGTAAREGRIPGTGLGLALCKGFAEKMGGRIWLESEPGRGSCFYFSAPFALAPEPDPDQPGPDSPAVPDARRALVLDDQEYNRIVLVDLLTTLGYTAQAAASGDEAISLATRCDFALVFLDYDLPGMSGLDVARAIRQLPNGSAQAHILATTAFSTPEKRQQCLDSGMNSFLGKPVTLERLRKVLADVTPQLTESASPPPGPPPPSDGLANLRLLARKKQVGFEDELALYLSELQVELEQLDEALLDEKPAEAAHYAHRLCGRFSFIYERELERLLREIEEDAVRERWSDARRLRAEVEAGVAALRVRLASSSPVAPPE